MKYINLFIKFVSVSLQGIMEYRLNFVFWTLVQIVIQFIMLAFFTVIFTNTETIAGWNFGETLFVFGTALLLKDVSMTLFLNLQEFSNLVVNGDFDLILIKPVNPIFYMAFQNLRFDFTLPAVIDLLILGYALSLLNLQITLASVLAYLALFVNSIVIIFAIALSVTTLNFWFHRMEYMFEFVWVNLHASRYPGDIYRNTGVLVLLFIPAIAIGTFPSVVLLRGPELSVILASYAVTIGLLAISISFWRYGVKSYSSASS